MTSTVLTRLAPALVSVAEANQQTLAAAMLTRALENVQLPDKRKAGDVWERIYVVTAFYVGLADDLGRQQYKSALEKVCGVALDLAGLGDAKKMQALREELAKYNPPAIYSGTGNQSAGSARLRECKRPRQGDGQIDRLPPDGPAIHPRLVHDGQARLPDHRPAHARPHFHPR